MVNSGLFAKNLTGGRYFFLLCVRYDCFFCFGFDLRFRAVAGGHHPSNYSQEFLVLWSSLTTIV